MANIRGIKSGALYVDSCIPARQWTDICNTQCSILSRFSHFHVSHFPPLQHGAAFSCPAISCLAFSASPIPCHKRKRKFLGNIMSSEKVLCEMCCNISQHIVKCSKRTARTAICRKYFCSVKFCPLFHVCLNF